MTGKKCSRKGGASSNSRRVFSHGCQHLREWCTRYDGSLLTALNSLSCPPGTVRTVCADCSLQSDRPNALKEKHIRKNAVSAGKHAICFDRARMQFFCIECDDYVYMEEYEAISFAAGTGFRGELGALSERVADVGPGPSDLTLADLTPKTEIPEEKSNEESRWPSASCDECATASVDASREAGYLTVGTSDPWPMGIRGLNNMGNTCFMNAILQALIRAPMLSEYYLSAKHCEANCRVSAEGGHCVECQLDIVISDVFSGSRLPYSPAKFLHTWWMMAGGFLSGYKQQDAHEFFLFILQMLTGHPDSIATSLFIGQVQSRVFCQGCGRNSVQKDEFSHLSLDVLPSSSLLPPAIAPRAKANPIVPKKKKGAKGAPSRGSITKGTKDNGTTGKGTAKRSQTAKGGTTPRDTRLSPGRTSNPRGDPSPVPDPAKPKHAPWNHPYLAGYLRWPGDSLVGCLRRFTFAEILDGTDDWRCPDCNTSTSRAVKQTSITKLPPVLTMHLKRFEFLGGHQARATKLETFVSFPLDGLDMSPYLTSRIDLGRHGVGAHLEFLYDAFAVVCHRGSCSGGHYVSYVRRDDRWYLADDAFITEVSQQVVENCQAYMIFYGLRQ
jgi:ubiquitin C-terminal hydrolase